VIGKASAYLHESPANTSTAMSGAVPALLGGVASLASTPTGATQLSGLLSSGNHDGSILNNLSNLFGGGAGTTAALHQGQGLLSTLFGDKVDTVTSTIAGQSGLGKSSASSLMALAAPLVMGVIGRLRSTQGLNPTGLANLLTSQKSYIASALPSSLSHLSSSTDVRGLESVTVTPVAAQSSSKWWPLLLLLVAGLGLLLYLLGRRPPAVTPPPVAMAPAPAAVEQVKLCSGENVGLTRESFNYNLARFLAGANTGEVPKTFVFDNLNFDTGTTNLTPASKQTVNDLITILKACPTAQVQLAGHTDNTGDPAANQTLSTERATAIQAMLVAGGVAPERLTTAGYGQDKPVASNDTEEGKARNRRTELIVLQK
jgi:outer membrane protein OmpA-like peptidoglycan-associated protein